MKKIKNVTPEEIAAWKARYGTDKVKEFTIPISDEQNEHDEYLNTVTGYFRKPDLKVIGAAGKFSETDPIRSGLILFEECFLGGDPEFRENDEVKMSAIKTLNGWFKIRVAVIKNV